jgi:hypothetical protein
LPPAAAAWCASRIPPRLSPEEPEDGFRLSSVSSRRGRLWRTVKSDGKRPRESRAPGRWLLVRGRGERPLPALLDAAQVRRHSSSRRPSVEPGELAILYAAVWQALYGVVEVTGVPEHDPALERWAWSFPIRPLAVVADLHDAPACEEAGIFPQSLWRHSHIRLTQEQFDAARDLVDAAAAR